MVCPKCAVLIDDNCDTCYSCGMEFRHAETPVKDNNEPPAPSKANKPISRLKNLNKKKIIFFSAITIVFVVLIVLFVKFFVRKDGISLAYKLNEKIGQNIVKLEKNAKIHVNTSSSSPAINKPADFDYIYESDKSIEVDGVKVPEWTITFYATDTDITKIYYRDYTQQKKSYKGIRMKNPVDIDDLKKCSDLEEVEECFGFKPISITFHSDKTKEYRYMFYFNNDDKDEERREFIITFDESDDVKDISETKYNNLNNILK